MANCECEQIGTVFRLKIELLINIVLLFHHFQNE